MAGRFVDVFKKISALHSKNAFAFAIIAGDLFADPAKASADDNHSVDKLLDGSIGVPLPTYFALGSSVLPQKVVEKLENSRGELCDNLYFLGKRTTIKTSEGIRIVALGGTLDPKIVSGASNDKYTPFYSNGDATALRGANRADILVTSQWPANIRKGSKVDVSSTQSDTVSSQQCISDLCATLKPRYHFSTSPAAYFEREPFFHPLAEASVDGYSLTRFISLASFDNPAKQKWIYAFTLDPTAALPGTIPAGTTPSPLSSLAKKRPAPSNGEFSRFTNDDRHYQRSNKRHRQPPPGPGECFFCLSNPNLATHLVTSIGSDAYLTTAKGPLSTAFTFPCLGFPSHMLIIPLPHAPTLASIKDPETRQSTYSEMRKYHDALHSMLRHLGQGQLGSVTWEVSRSNGIHTHWQFLPLGIDLIRRGLAEAAFKVEAENENYPRFETSHPGKSQDDNEDNDFFKVWIWTPQKDDQADGDTNHSSEDVATSPNGKEVCLKLPLDESFRFDLQFGRRVLAKLLGLESRMNWRDCGQTEQDETAEAEAFKKAFKSYDFTLDE